MGFAADCYLEYVVFVLRTDSKGEGGTAIMMQQALVVLRGKPAVWVMFEGLTAMSVLSAAEGRTVLNPAAEAWVLPVAVTALLALFLIQRYGTQKIDAFFGSVMLFWFGTLAVLEVCQIIRMPQIMAAANPYYGLNFIAHHGWGGFVSLGAVVLAVTGAEALYADVGPRFRRLGSAWFYRSHLRVLKNWRQVGYLYPTRLDGCDVGFSNPTYGAVMPSEMFCGQVSIFPLPWERVRERAVWRSTRLCAAQIVYVFRI
ncbi:hypothetical protein EGS38_07920 [Neisseria chenwenguii]|nr:KUP/HAK/KT family potassium transporter [Neisseria chenwenguii]ROV55834.1 hypothetical protein EGS38_07920 [Neisseria chenwenguii]